MYRIKSFIFGFLLFILATIACNLAFVVVEFLFQFLIANNIYITNIVILGVGIFIQSIVIVAASIIYRSRIKILNLLFLYVPEEYFIIRNINIKYKKKKLEKKRKEKSVNSKKNTVRFSLKLNENKKSPRPKESLPILELVILLFAILLFTMVPFIILVILLFGSEQLAIHISVTFFCFIISTVIAINPRFKNSLSQISFIIGVTTGIPAALFAIFNFSK